MATVANNDNLYGVAKLIVDNAGYGNYTTLASAMAAAVSGDTIYLKKSVTENVTLTPGVNIVSFIGNELTPNVTITGKLSMTGAGTCTISGIRLTTNSDFLLAVTGSAASIVNLENCYLNCSNNTGISHTSSSSSSSINIFNCNGNIGTTGISLFASTSAGGMNINYSRILNSGLATTASTVSAATIDCRYSTFHHVFSTSSTGICIFRNCIISATAINTAGLTTAGTTQSELQYTNIGSGTASCISIGAGTTVQVLDCEFTSSNTNVITGAGTLYYTGIVFGNGSTKALNTTTQVGGVMQGGVFQAPSAGFLGEQTSSSIAVGSAINLTTNTAANVTSISLTAGIWNVSAIIAFGGGAITGTCYEGSINTTSATRGTSGNNANSTTASPNAACNTCVSVPDYRLTLTSTTTVYLVAFSLFTIGTVTAYGTIRATRVG